MIKAVFLDIDDTVLDFEAYVRLALREGFDRFGLPPYREEMLPVFTGVNNRLWQRIERGEMTREQLIDVRFQTVFQELGITGDARAFERYFRDAIWDCAIPVAGAAEMVPWLGARYILCAASNGPYDQQRARLALSGFLPWFRHLFINEEIGWQKPARAFFDEAIRRLNAGREAPVARSEIMMIGDSLTSDMRGGIDSGLVTCYFNRFHAEPPTGMRVDYTVSRLEAAREILEKL